MRLKVTNQSLIIAQQEVGRAIKAVNKQIDQWRKVWRGADSYLSTHTTAWDAEIVIFDDADQAGALGYHDVTPEGKAYARVFVKPSIVSHASWESVLSHEVLELLGDVGANQWANDAQGRLWAYEMCDACQNNSYTIDGVEMSDWVTPNYFIPGAPGPYNYLDTLSRPFEIKNGYGIVANISNVHNVFGRGECITDIVADNVPPDWDKLHPAARTYKRLVAFD